MKQSIPSPKIGKECMKYSYKKTNEQKNKNVISTYVIDTFAVKHRW